MAPEGVIVDGWSYVIAAYSITSGVLLIYAWSLRARLRQARNTDDDNQ
jgi:hypothetical protein